MTIIEKQDLIQQGETLLNDVLEHDKFIDQEYSIIEYESVNTFLNKSESLLKNLRKIKTPNTLIDLYLSELFLILIELNNVLTGKLQSQYRKPEEVLQSLQLTVSDIDFKKNWILSNKDVILSANNDLKSGFSNQYISPVSLGSPNHRNYAIDLVQNALNQLINISKTHFSYLNNLQYVFDEFTIDLDENSTYSRANRVGKIATISLYNSVIYINGKIVLNDNYLISAFAHEVLGHLLNYSSTEHSKLPSYIKENFYIQTHGPSESVTQYFESRFFDVLKSVKNIDSVFTTSEPFELIYKKQKTTAILKKYFDYRREIALWTLANSKVSDQTYHLDEISKYSINKQFALHMVNKHKQDWDSVSGLLYPGVVQDLKYAVDPVNKILSQNKNIDIKKFENVIVTGRWSTKSFEDWVRLSL